MRLVFCTYDDKSAINGINTWLLHLLPALKAEGHTVSLIYISWVQENECTTIPKLKDLGIECCRVSGKKYIETEVAWILNFVENFKPDVFVANHILQAWYASKWILEAKIPTIGVIHNDDYEYQLLIDSFLNANQNYFTAIVTVSEFLQQKVSPIVKNSIVKRIPCGTPLFLEKAKFNKDKPFNIFYVGRLTNLQKNISLVLKTLSVTVKAVPNVEAYIYGSGPDEQEVYELINQYNCQNNIHFMGLVANDVIHKKLLNANVIILMSDFEGLPVSLMEAMARGVVPVCKQTESGLSELIIDNYTGFYVDDTDEFVGKIDYLTKNPAKWEELSINVKNHIEKTFSSHKVLNDWIALFREISTDNMDKVKLPKRVKLPKNSYGAALGERREPSLVMKFASKIKSIYLNYIEQ